MKKFRFTLVILLSIICYTAFAQSSNIKIGQWRDHLSYYYTHGVCKVEDKILVSSQSALFYYNPQTQKTEKLTKVNGLSDAGIGVTAYDKETKTIVITYENSNIDIVQQDNVYNIPDIKNRSIEGSKAINDIYFKDGKAYLACGFGVVVLDLKLHEIYDTWYLGENSSAIKVNCVYIDDSTIYAGTVNGLLAADKNSKTLAASQSWHNKDITTAPNNEINYVMPYGTTKILVSYLDSLSNRTTVLAFDGTNVLDTLINDLYIVKIRNFNDEIGVIDYRAFSIYDTNMHQTYHISDAWNPIHNLHLDVNDFVIDNGDLWFSHRHSGAIYLPDFRTSTTDNHRIIYPDGPFTNDVYSITAAKNGKIYVAPGGKTVTSQNKFVDANAYVYNGYYWYKTDRGNLGLTDSLFDVLNVTIDPRDENHAMMSTWWNGVIEMRNDTMVNLYSLTNTDSMLESHHYNCRIACAEYDVSGNLLIANSLVPHGFVYFTFKDVWGNFLTSSFLSSNDEIRGMALDSRNHYKLLYTTTNKILMIDNNGNMLWINPNNGSLLETGQINCMTQDREGEIWIGTEKGIKIIYSLYGAFDNPNGTTSKAECSNVVYGKGSYAQYLLSFENILCIMVDGANNKWIGTERNGIYVLSANGDKELYHFTLENSPLFSNKIISMAQNPVTGEVFIGTDRGLISYRAETLLPETEKSSLTVFPNPIRPGYDGLIAIKGFVEDSDVRITDANGRMVAHLKSNGGQAVWDGRNFQGQKVGTGVYYVFGSANEGDVTANGKFLIVK